LAASPYAKPWVNVPQILITHSLDFCCLEGAWRLAAQTDHKRQREANLQASIAIGVKLDYCSFLEDLSMNKQRERLSNSVPKAEGD